MHEWKFAAILKSGVTISGVIETDTENSLEIAKELFPEDKPEQITYIEDKKIDKTLFFRVQEVAAFEIMQLKDVIT